MAVEEETQGGTTTAAKPLPELAPWRVVGWVFRDGECVAIERHGDKPVSKARDAEP